MAGETTRSAIRRPETQLSGHQESILNHLRAICRCVRTDARVLEKELQIAGAQLTALGLIAGSEGLAVSSLAQAMDIRHSTASNLVRKLLERGLVESNRSGLDRRISHLELTNEGQRVLRKMGKPGSSALATALSALDESSLARLNRELGKVQAALSPGFAPHAHMRVAAKRR